MSVQFVEDIEVSDVEMDFDLDVPCEFNYRSHLHPSCETPAEWAVRINCCGHLFLFCQKHFDRLLDGMQEGFEFIHDGPDGCGAVLFGNPISSAERLDKRVSK